MDGEERFFGWGSSSSSSSSSEEESGEWWNNWKNAAEVHYLAHKCDDVAKNILSGSDVASIGSQYIKTNGNGKSKTIQTRRIDNVK